MGSNWLQDPSNALGIHVDLEALRMRLQTMSDAELLAFGRQMHDLVYPLTYDGDGKPSVSAFSIQLDEARAEWRRRNPRKAHAVPPTKSCLLFVALLLVTSCGKPTREKAPTQKEPPKLSDSYAKAALMAVLAIRSDVSVTSELHGRKVVSGTTKSQIDTADSEARTPEEQAMTAFLRTAYKVKLGQNDILASAHNLLDTEIKIYRDEVSYHKLDPSTPWTITKKEIERQGKWNDAYNAEIGKAETACYEPLIQGLRERSPVIPETCKQMIGPAPPPPGAGLQGPSENANPGK